MPAPTPPRAAALENIAVACAAIASTYTTMYNACEALKDTPEYNALRYKCLGTDDEIVVITTLRRSLEPASFVYALQILVACGVLSRTLTKRSTPRVPAAQK